METQIISVKVMYETKVFLGLIFFQVELNHKQYVKHIFLVYKRKLNKMVGTHFGANRDLKKYSVSKTKL